ncbi:hypothetical protein SEVIR_2G062200v4 [Setaria viridis]|uniref:Uncharacterized protein n=1 Tax=Setaria viridis TaxID=4556 RepID=A0A4U6VM79_SETVI|nr:hypothetical protein SEVIR_2G062200v2 [Setaria viridis]
MTPRPSARAGSRPRPPAPNLGQRRRSPTLAGAAVRLCRATATTAVRFGRVVPAVTICTRWAAVAGEEIEPKTREPRCNNRMDSTVEEPIVTGEWCGEGTAAGSVGVAHAGTDGGRPGRSCPVRWMAGSLAGAAGVAAVAPRGSAATMTLRGKAAMALHGGGRWLPPQAAAHLCASSSTGSSARPVQDEDAGSFAPPRQAPPTSPIRPSSSHGAMPCI